MLILGSKFDDKMKKYNNYTWQEIADENQISIRQIQNYLKPFRHLINTSIRKRYFTEDERQFVNEQIKHKRKIPPYTRKPKQDI